MSNRIESHFQSQRKTGSVRSVSAPLGSLTETPARVTLKMDREFSVDMEGFFEFSFSFAEALVALEDRYGSRRQQVTSMARFLQAEADAQNDVYADVDARWM